MIGTRRRALSKCRNAFWYPIFTFLEGHIEFILANAFQIRNIEHKKTDKLDSERIAICCPKNLITPSRIYTKDYQDLRSITRAREIMVNARSKVKNQIHNHLRSAASISPQLYPTLLSSPADTSLNSFWKERR